MVMLTAKEGGRIFMPLYQNQGEDGFFIIRPVAARWLKLSAALRKLKVEEALVLLPGIKRYKDQKNALIVDAHIARFFATEFFHLLGYRQKIQDGKKKIFIRREFDVAGAVKY